jgi:hypothetical protein
VSMDKHRLFKECMISIGVICLYLLPIVSVSANSNFQKYGYVFKSTRSVKYSRHLSTPLITKVMHPHTKDLYFKNRETTHRGVKYIGLQRQVVGWTFTKGHARRKTFRTFYVRRSAVKKVKTVLAQTSIKKTPVNLKSSQYNFWTYPRGTRQSVKEQYRGSTYRFRTLYATEKMHTRLHGTFIKVQTASGKKLGWIYQGAVLSGRYLDPVAYLTRNTQLTKRVWVNKKKPRIKVASLSQDNQLKTLIVQAEDNSATVITIDPVRDTYYVLRSNRTRTEVKKTSNKMYNDTFYRYGYDGVRDNRVIFVRFFLDDATHGSRIDVKMNGQLHQAY